MRQLVTTEIVLEHFSEKLEDLVESCWVGQVLQLVC